MRVVSLVSFLAVAQSVSGLVYSYHSKGADDVFRCTTFSADFKVCWQSGGVGSRDTWTRLSDDLTGATLLGHGSSHSTSDGTWAVDNIGTTFTNAASEFVYPNRCTSCTTLAPTTSPTAVPTGSPTTGVPTTTPTAVPTGSPTTGVPTTTPTSAPTFEEAPQIFELDLDLAEDCSAPTWDQAAFITEIATVMTVAESRVSINGADADCKIVVELDPGTASGDTTVDAAIVLLNAYLDNPIVPLEASTTFEDMTPEEYAAAQAQIDADFQQSTADALGVPLSDVGDVTSTDGSVTLTVEVKVKEADLADKEAKLTDKNRMKSFMKGSLKNKKVKSGRGNKKDKADTKGSRANGFRLGRGKRASNGKRKHAKLMDFFAGFASSFDKWGSMFAGLSPTAKPTLPPTDAALQQNQNNGPGGVTFGAQTAFLWRDNYRGSCASSDQISQQSKPKYYTKAAVAAKCEELGCAYAIWNNNGKNYRSHPKKTVIFCRSDARFFTSVSIPGNKGTSGWHVTRAREFGIPVAPPTYESKPGKAACPTALKVWSGPFADESAAQEVCTTIGCKSYTYRVSTKNAIFCDLSCNWVKEAGVEATTKIGSTVYEFEVAQSECRANDQCKAISCTGADCSLYSSDAYSTVAGQDTWLPVGTCTQGPADYTGSVVNGADLYLAAKQDSDYRSGRMSLPTPPAAAAVVGQITLGTQGIDLTNTALAMGNQQFSFPSSWTIETRIMTSTVRQAKDKHWVNFARKSPANDNCMLGLVPPGSEMWQDYTMVSRNGVLTTYIDGVESPAAKWGTADACFGSAANVPGELMIGNDADAGSATGGQFTNNDPTQSAKSKFAHFLIYNGAMTAADVKARVGYTTVADLLPIKNAWTFEDGENLGKDFGPNGQDLLAYGGAIPTVEVPLGGGSKTMDDSTDLSCDFDGAACDWRNANTDDFDWTAGSSATKHSKNTGPSAANSGAKYMFIETSSPRTKGDVASFESAKINVAVDQCLSFDYHAYGSQIGSLSLEAQVDGTNQWLSIFDIKGNQGNSWQHQEQELSSFVGQKVSFRFVGTRGGGYKGDVAIDSISYATCASAQASSADLNCDFEAETTCAWTQVEEDDFDWSIQEGTTKSGATGPGQAKSGSKYAFIEASNPRKVGDEAMLETGRFHVVEKQCLTFSYHMYGVNQGSLNLEYSKVGTSGWTSIFSKSGAQGASWNTITVGLPTELDGNSVQLRFRATRGNGYRGDTSIDNISYETCPAGNVAINVEINPPANAGRRLLGQGGGFDKVAYMNGIAPALNMPAQYTLHKAGKECNSPDTRLGTFDDVQECADACKAKDGCLYFVYSPYNGNRKGQCWQEHTTTSDCSEGWQTDSYDFYILNEADFIFKHKGHCNRGWIRSAQKADHVACAAYCQSTPGCNYMAYQRAGTDCAIYTGTCPDDNNQNDYDSYRVKFNKPVLKIAVFTETSPGTCPCTMTFEAPSDAVQAALGESDPAALASAMTSAIAAAVEADPSINQGMTVSASVEVAIDGQTSPPTTRAPTKRPTKSPTTKRPTTKRPTRRPTTKRPTRRPTTKRPTRRPTTKRPTRRPTTKRPTRRPTKRPTKHPTNSWSFWG